MLRRDEDISTVGGTATAFFYRQNISYLITNWHNVTGVNPENGQNIHSGAMFPNVIRIHYKKWTDETRKILCSDFFEVDLYNGTKPQWFEHSTRSLVDVVALPILPPANFANLYINDISQEHTLEALPGMECFILDFPEGLFGPAFTPIWKRGSIASEPYPNYPYLLDSATRRGMSGSPVIIRHNGIFGVKGPRLTGAELIGTVERFVAIYSGRVGDDQLGGQLGRAWRAELLDDIFSLSTPGSHPILAPAR